MKKQLHYFVIGLLGLSPLLTIAAELQPKKVETKQLQQRYKIFKKAHQEYDDALAKYQACATNVCKQEKEMLEATRLNMRWRVPEAYQQYPGANQAYQACLRYKCGKEYAAFHKAAASLSKRITALYLGIYFGILGGALAIALGTAAGPELIALGTAAGAELVEKSKVSHLIKKYELDDPREKEILEKFLKTKRIEGSLAKGIEISGALRDALAELYYGSAPTQEQINLFNDQLSGYDVIVLEPSL